MTAADTPSPTGRLRLAGDLASSLAGLQRTVRRRVRSQLHFEPLAGAQGELLRLVTEQPGISVTAAARELHLAGNSVSTQVQHLIKLGYLDRETSPTDRRGAVLRATPAGTERLARWADERSELFARQLLRLGESDLDALTAALPALRALADAIAADTRAEAGGEPSPVEPAEPAVPAGPAGPAEGSTA